MNHVEVLQDQLKRSIEGKSWDGSAVLEALAGVTDVQAASKPVAHAHSAWEIVLHVTTWLNFVRSRLQGGTGEVSVEENWPTVKTFGPAAWADTVSELKRSYVLLHEAIGGLTEARLQEPVVGRKYDVRFLLCGVIQHSAYHAGQIGILKGEYPKEPTGG